MTLPSSSQSISFKQIRDEFGASGSNGTSVQLGAYRISQDVGTDVQKLEDLPLDTGVPQSGPIKASDLQGKRLNVVVDLFSGIPTTRENVRTKYDAQQIVVVGGFKTNTQVPVAGSGSRIIAYVNKQIGSAKGNRNNVALKTGQWGSGAKFDLIIGKSGGLYGAGGDGGAGSGFGNSQFFPGNDSSGTLQNITSGQNGGPGTSALGVQYPTTIINQGTIRAGRGGGGGGGSGYGRDYHDIQDCGNERPSPVIGGGGGAGGSGFPAGSNGSRSTYLSRLANKQGGSTTYAADGTGGSLTQDGQGGARGSATPQDYSRCSTKIAFSGAGGGAEQSGGSGNFAHKSFGSGGQRGYAIIIDSTGSLVDPVSGNVPDGTNVDGTVL
jgi:hypothetical protein